MASSAAPSSSGRSTTPDRLRVSSFMRRDASKPACAASPAAPNVPAALDMSSSPPDAAAAATAASRREALLLSAASDDARRAALRSSASSCRALSRRSQKSLKPSRVKEPQSTTPSARAIDAPLGLGSPLPSQTSSSLTASHASASSLE